jgi:hypothetical protein
MIKEYAQLKWTYVENDAFDNINATMVATPDIQSIHFFEDFLLYTFASEYSLVSMLIQKD